jgi:predicted MFS family arabinose efflux permease
VRFRDAFHLPLVRAVMPATIAVALGLGALFSLGIEFVRKVLQASNAEFGVLIALFGVGAVAGLGLLQRFRELDKLRATQLGVLAVGIIVALFSLSPVTGLAFLGAAAFGAAAAWTLASGMGVLQSRLDGQDRIIAFAAFHIVIRSGLALAAVGAGAAGQLVGNVHWPVVGMLEPSRLVLLCSGILVVLSAARVRTTPAGSTTAPRDTPRHPDARPQPERA